MSMREGGGSLVTLDPQMPRRQAASRCGSDGGRGRERNGVLRELAAEVQLRVRAFELAHWHGCDVRICHYSRGVLQTGGAHEPVRRYSREAQKIESVGRERGCRGGGERRGSCSSLRMSKKQASEEEGKLECGVYGTGKETRMVMLQRRSQRSQS